MNDILIPRKKFIDELFDNIGYTISDPTFSRWKRYLGVKATRLENDWYYEQIDLKNMIQFGKLMPTYKNCDIVAYMVLK